MWDVVIWQEGKCDGMDYVPTSWGDGQGMYKWPKNCSRTLLEKLIDACDPLTQYKYKMHKAITKKSKIMSLTAAKAYCLKGLETSNVESNCETESETGEDDEPLKSQQEKLVDTIASSHLDERLIKRKFNSPVNPMVKPCSEGKTSSCHLEDENIAHNESDDDELLHRKGVTPNSNQSSEGSIASLAEPTVELVRPSDTPTVRSQTRAGPHDNMIYTKLCSIEFEVQQLRRQFNTRIDSLEKKIFDVTKKTQHFGSMEDVPLFLADLPAKNDAELLRINDMIKSSENNMDELVNSLYFCGGDNLHKVIYAQMKMLLTKEVSLLYSGEGKKSKKSFVTLEIFRAITRAVRRRFKEATDKEIRSHISLFLAGAKDREGGRKARAVGATAEHEVAD